MKTHYKNGAPSNWADRHVSEYATTHPWEDFAKTVNVYLDMMAIATTANDQGRSQFDLSPEADAINMVDCILDIVIEVSEYNLDLGLTPLLPEQLSDPVLEKIAFINELRRLHLPDDPSRSET